jgi:hypothetical protein
MSKKISVLIKEPGKKPRHVNISDTLENLQKTVDGFIETVTIAEDACVICDENGRLRDKPWCCTVAGWPLVGTVILCGVDGDGFADWPLSYEETKKLFPNMWEV